MPEEEYSVVKKADWFKIHHAGWLEGSLRYNKDYDGDRMAAFRGVMADICALISRSRFRDGTLRYAVGRPIPRNKIAEVLNISIGLLNEFIELSLKDTNNDDSKHTRIEIWEDGTIEVVNWNRHQSVPPKKRRNNKNTDEETLIPKNIPLDQTTRKKQRQVLAVKMGYLEPESVDIGKDIRKSENIMKQHMKDQGDGYKAP